MTALIAAPSPATALAIFSRAHWQKGDSASNA
jgi:hypothetical protein